MTTMFKVQDNWPVPAVNRAPAVSRRKFPVEGMAPGQMFFLSGRKTKSVSAYVSRITKNLPGKYTARRCWGVQVGDAWAEADAETTGATEGVGVWRLE